MYVPTLSERGYVEDTRAILAYYLGCYIVAEHDQSYSQSGYLPTLSYSYSKGINAPTEFAQYVEMDLNKILAEIFPLIRIRSEVKWDDIKTKAAVFIWVEVGDDTNQQVSLGYLTSYDPNGLGRIIEINNYGDGRGILGEM